MSLPAPMRDAPLVVRCARCDQPATGRCLRCDRPACDAHAPTVGRRCAPCESELERRLVTHEPASIDEDRYRAKTVRIGLGSAGLVGGITAILFSQLTGWWATVLISVIAGGLGGLAAMVTMYALALLTASTRAGRGALGRHLTRWQFIRERPGRRRLRAADRSGEEE